MFEMPQDDEIQPLSGKPFFNVIISPSHIKPRYNMFLPAKIYGFIPRKEISAVLMCNGKEWEMVCYGSQMKGKRLNTQWKHFVDDNVLKVGDACVFELMVCTTEQLKFRVQILRGDIPVALQARIRGASSDNPLVIE